MDRNGAVLIDPIFPPTTTRVQASLHTHKKWIIRNNFENWTVTDNPTLNRLCSRLKMDTFIHELMRFIKVLLILWCYKIHSFRMRGKQTEIMRGLGTLYWFHTCDEHVGEHVLCCTVFHAYFIRQFRLCFFLRSWLQLFFFFLRLRCVLCEILLLLMMCHLSYLLIPLIFNKKNTEPHNNKAKSK